MFLHLFVPSTPPQSPPVSMLPSSKPPPPFIPVEEELSFRYESVPRREETREELRAQALARQLVRTKRRQSCCSL